MFREMIQCGSTKLTNPTEKMLFAGALAQKGWARSGPEENAVRLLRRFPTRSSSSWVSSALGQFFFPNTFRPNDHR
jgi:hypothetical protein